MFDNIMNLFKKWNKNNTIAAASNTKSKEAAKERLHLVLMQDRANVSADFLELMKQEIIDVIKKYIDVDESAIDVRLTNKENADGTNGAPALYANIPIVNIKNEARKVELKDKKETSTKEEKKVETKKEVKKDEVKKDEQKQEQNINEKDKKQKDELESKKEEKTKNKDTEENEKRKDKKNTKEKSKVIN